MNTHVVLKRLSTSAGVLEPGAEVDASNWQHTRLLEEQRRIKPIQPNERVKRMGRKEQDANTGN